MRQANARFGSMMALLFSASMLRGFAVHGRAEILERVAFEGNYSAMIVPSANAVADFNGDCIADLLVVSQYAFVSFRFVSFRFVSFRFVSFRFVSFRFVSFRFVSFRFVSFRFVSLNMQSVPNLSTSI
jgi:hypothetical protein